MSETSLCTKLKQQRDVVAREYGKAVHASRDLSSQIDIANKRTKRDTERKEELRDYWDKEEKACKGKGRHWVRRGLNGDAKKTCLANAEQARCAREKRYWGRATNDDEPACYDSQAEMYRQSILPKFRAAVDAVQWTTLDGQVVGTGLSRPQRDAALNMENVRRYANACGFVGDLTEVAKREGVDISICEFAKKLPPSYLNPMIDKIEEGLKLYLPETQAIFQQGRADDTTGHDELNNMVIDARNNEWRRKNHYKGQEHKIRVHKAENIPQSPFETFCGTSFTRSGLAYFQRDADGKFIDKNYGPFIALWHHVYGTDGLVKACRRRADGKASLVDTDCKGEWGACVDCPEGEDCKDTFCDNVPSRMAWETCTSPCATEWLKNQEVYRRAVWKPGAWSKPTCDGPCDDTPQEQVYVWKTENPRGKTCPVKDRTRKTQKCYQHDKCKAKRQEDHDKKVAAELQAESDRRNATRTQQDIKECGAAHFNLIPKHVTASVPHSRASDTAHAEGTGETSGWGMVNPDTGNRSCFAGTCVGPFIPENSTTNTTICFHPIHRDRLAKSPHKYFVDKRPDVCKKLENHYSATCKNFCEGNLSATMDYPIGTQNSLKLAVGKQERQAGAKTCCLDVWPDDANACRAANACGGKTATAYGVTTCGKRITKQINCNNACPLSSFSILG